MRTLSIVIEFDEEIVPHWIWESHKNQSYLNDVFVSAIIEGNIIKEGTINE